MTDINMAHMLILRARRSVNLSQREFAERVGTSQPAIAKLEQGSANPTIGTLARCAAAAGFAMQVDLVPLSAPDPVVERYKKDVDRTLLRENLRKSVDERVRSLMDWQESGRELQAATRAARRRT